MYMITLLTNFSAQTVEVDKALGDKVLMSSMSAQTVEVDKALGDTSIIATMSCQYAGYGAMGEQTDEVDRRFCVEKITRTK